MSVDVTKEIILGDGTIIENSYCGYYDRDLWCFISGKTIAECAQLFSDHNKVSSIISRYFVKTYKYTGFTKLLMIRTTDETIDVRLTWPEGGEHSVEELEESEDA